MRETILQELYPSGIVAQQTVTFDLGWDDSYSFSITAPLECRKAVITTSGYHPENGVILSISSSAGTKTFSTSASSGTKTYNGLCKKISLSRITFPEGYGSAKFTLTVKMYY